ncbi:ERC protein 2 [Labeo rohita]|uniref:ERC protein 2 n=1 Tax=Labeo rohita TaxID=84645 RepID=A0ABQ8M9Z0_LABRO|nr:ERC protein 2 [Labeo rohita]
MYGSARAVGHIEGSPARSPRLPRSPRLGHRRANSGSSGGKTLSMENIQSLNAAYATSGPMYLSDHEGVGSTATYPKGTMTLGRATSRAMYGGRVTAMGSTPNIATAGLPHADLLSYGDLGSLSMLHHQGTPSALLRQAVRGGGGELLELQAQLRDMQRENELLRRELDLKDSKLGSSTNSIKSFWSPELKKERRFTLPLSLFLSLFVIQLSFWLLSCHTSSLLPLLILCPFHPSCSPLLYPLIL